MLVSGQNQLYTQLVSDKEDQRKRMLYIYIY